MTTIQLDARGCACPEPVIKVKKAMEQPFDAIEILVDNNTAVQNIKRFAGNKGCDIIISETDQHEFQLTITKR